MAKSSLSSVWCNIVKAIKLLPEFDINQQEIFTLVPGSNVNILFWKDRWCGSLTLQERYPRLYDLESKKTCLLTERVDHEGYKWRWKSKIKEEEVASDLADLCNHIHGVNTEPVQNGLRFTTVADGKFTVNVLRKMLDATSNHHNGDLINWGKVIPLKVKCFVWRAAMERLPVASNLTRRGINIPNSLCPLCNGELETCDHLFVKCRIVQEAQYWIFKWCGIPVTNFDTVNEFLNFAAAWGNCPRKRERLKVIFYGVLWYSWLARNNTIFKEKKPIPTKIADEMITQTYSWFKYRSNDLQCRWVDWCISPFS